MGLIGTWLHTFIDGVNMNAKGADVMDNLNQIKTVVNGGLDTTNWTPGAVLVSNMTAHGNWSADHASIGHSGEAVLLKAIPGLNGGVAEDVEKAFEEIVPKLPTVSGESAAVKIGDSYSDTANSCMVTIPIDATITALDVDFSAYIRSYSAGGTGYTHISLELDPGTGSFSDLTTLYTDPRFSLYQSITNEDTSITNGKIVTLKKATNCAILDFTKVQYLRFGTLSGTGTIASTQHSMRVYAVK